MAVRTDPEKKLQQLNLILEGKERRPASPMALPVSTNVGFDTPNKGGLTSNSNSAPKAVDMLIAGENRSHEGDTKPKKSQKRKRSKASGDTRSARKRRGPLHPSHISTSNGSAAIGSPLKGSKAAPDKLALPGGIGSAAALVSGFGKGRAVLVTRSHGASPRPSSAGLRAQGLTRPGDPSLHAAGSAARALSLNGKGGSNSSPEWTARERELLAKVSQLENHVEHVRTQLTATHKKFLDQQQSTKKCREKLLNVLRDKSRMDRKLREDRLARDTRVIGGIVQMQNSFSIHDVWEDGEMFKDLQRAKSGLEDEFESLLRRKKDLKQAKNKLRKRIGTSPTSSPSNTGSETEFPNPRPPGPTTQEQATHLSVQTEVYQLETSRLKKRQQELESRERELILLKHKQIKFIKMMRHEKRSAYQGRLLNERYLLLRLIGRGGFSEVWKAYDLNMHRDVACKIHALNEKWNDRKKENYTRHATREAHIQKQLDHPRIVHLYDVFGIDMNSFCTVLELCEGQDLDVYLKEKRPLPEREARSIIVQLFEGLCYLAQQKQPIIHYDLKPGNLLYHAGQIKITDFGLSKIMQKDQFEMELTSQGAGTYWYLPPECFLTGEDPPKISTGVDIWSAGCIFYEMIYGKRPFGHNMTQEKILGEGTILRADPVEFPANPKCSDEAKDLMRQCLTRDIKNRPGPLAIFQTHPYFAKLRG